MGDLETTDRQQRRARERARRKARRRTAVALGAAVGGLGAGLSPLRAATLTVTSLGDDVTDDSVVTLREALACIGTAGAGCNDEVTNGGGPFGTSDTILFQAGLNGTIPVGKSLFISNDLVIDGPGPAAITLDGGGVDRVLTLYCHYQSPTGLEGIDVAIEGLTITGGYGLYDGGAGIRATCPGDYDASLALNDVVITDNEVQSGKKGKNEDGGGISSRYFDLDVADSRITLNTAVESGGGIAVSFADATITRTTIADNDAADGGGIFIEGKGVTLEVRESTISGNDAEFDGGGILAESGALEMVNSTVSGNTSQEGGGAELFYETAAIDHSTLADNTATFGPALASIHSDLVVTHTIFADSTVPVTPFLQAVAESAASDPDLYLSDTNESFYWSLIENPDGLALAGGNNILNQDPNLGALGSNGGSTETHEPQPGSPAIDAGDPAILGAPPTDQTGAARIQGAAIDIGAVEAQQSVLEIPALGGAGLAALGAGLAAAGGAALRRRKHKKS